MNWQLLVCSGSISSDKQRLSLVSKERLEFGHRVDEKQKTIERLEDFLATAEQQRDTATRNARYYSEKVVALEREVEKLSMQNAKFDSNQKSS